MARINNEEKYPLNEVTKEDRWIGSDENGFTKNFSPDSLASYIGEVLDGIKQDNRIVVKEALEDQNGKTSDVALAVNATTGFTITDKEIYIIENRYFKAVDDLRSKFVIDYYLLKTGKGSYGLGSGVTLVESDFFFLRTTDVAIVTSDKPNPPVVEYITTIDIDSPQDAVNNSLDSYTIESNTDTFFVLTSFSKPVPRPQKLYRFVGVDGTYGSGGTATQQSDFLFVEDLTGTATNPTQIFANSVIFSAVDNLTSTNVQDAIEELLSQLEAHVSDTDNPHQVTKSQVGLSNADNTSDLDKPISTATQLALDDKLELEDLPEVPEYTLSLIDGSNQVDLLKDNVVVSTIDLTPYLDDTNLARITQGVLDAQTGVVTFTRDDNSTFTIDLSELIDIQVQSDWNEVSSSAPAFILNKPENLSDFNDDINAKNEVVNVLTFGASGDGVTDDTAAIQSALNTGRTVYFPSRNGYKVSQITLLDDQMIYGDSQHLVGIIGDGSGATTVVIGDGSGAIRRNVLRDIRIENPNGTAVYADVAPNLNVDRAFIRGVQGDGLVLFLTYRTNITNSTIGCSGAFSGVRGLDNINGLVIQGNQISGGSAGTAITLGRSQGVSIISNVIEVSKHGIWIASTNDTGAGNCNGVNIIGNYIEQCETPFKIATIFRVLGLNMRGNFISNTAFNFLPNRDSMITLGRIDSGTIENNSYYVSAAGDETIYNFELNSASGDIKGLHIGSNYVNGNPLSYFKFSGSFGSNVSVIRNVGGLNSFSFANDENSLGSLGLKEWISKEYDSSNLTGNFTSIISSEDMDFGGAVFSAEIIDYDGLDLTGVEIRVGSDRTGETDSIFLEPDISTLNYSLGRAKINHSNSFIIRPDFNLNIRVKDTLTGSPVGKFRIKIKYRVN